MRNFIAPANIIDLQRQTLLSSMQDECRRLLADGYPIDADRVLDEMLERKRAWQEEMHASS